MGVDAARGAALVGMVAVHIYPLVADDGGPAWAWSLFAGRSAALFALLAGVGLAFSSGGSRPPADGWVRSAAAAGVAARAVVVGLLGLLVGSFVADPYLILPYYGVMFLLAVPVLFSPPRVLVFLAVVCALVVPFVVQALRSVLPFPFVENPSLLDGVTDPWRLLTSLVLTGIYPALPWMAYLCTGLLVGRCDLRDPRVARRLLAWGVGLAVLPRLVSRLLLDVLGGYDALLETPGMSPADVDDVVGWGPDPVLPTATDWWLAIPAAHSTTPVDLVHTTGSALAVLGAALLVERSRLGRRLLAPLAAAGSLTLTVYTGQVVLTATGWGADHPDALFLAQVAALLVLATLWRRYRGQGPLERVAASCAHRARDAVLHRRDGDARGR